MKNRAFALLLASALTGSAMAGWAQQKKGSPKPVVPRATVAADLAPAPSTLIKGKPTNESVNADQAYKANCSRCHGAPRKFSDRATATIMRHMRVRANLTAEETRAILRYLTE